MYEIFEQLLQKFKITPYKVSKDTGIPQSTLSTWKIKRTKIGPEHAEILAKYFGVTIDYLMTGRESSESKKYYINDETANMAQTIFENKELRLLFDSAKDANPEDIETVHNMLLALKRKERGSND